jgi:hypothetical protein
MSGRLDVACDVLRESGFDDVAELLVALRRNYQYSISPVCHRCGVVGDAKGAILWIRDSFDEAELLTMSAKDRVAMPLREFVFRGDTTPK